MSAPSKTVKEQVAQRVKRACAHPSDEEILGVYLLARSGRGGSSARGLRAVFELGRSGVADTVKEDDK